MECPIRLSSCDHYFCQPCVEEWFRSTQSCPTCRSPQTNIDTANLAEQAHTLRSILGEEQRFCSYKPQGCHWVGPGYSFPSHLANDCLVIKQQRLEQEIPKSSFQNQILQSQQQKFEQMEKDLQKGTAEIHGLGAENQGNKHRLVCMVKEKHNLEAEIHRLRAEIQTLRSSFSPSSREHDAASSKSDTNERTSGDMDTMRAGFWREIEFKNNLAFVNCNRGFALDVEEEDLDRAIEMLWKEVKKNPNCAYTYSNLGGMLLGCGGGGLDLAIKLFRWAIELDPNFARAHNSLGFALQAKGDLDAAIVAFRQALQLKPTFSRARSNLGFALQVKGDPEAAVAPFRQALEDDPNNADAQRRLGCALRAKGDTDAAIALHQRAAGRAPSSADVQNELGDMLKLKGEGKAAGACFRRALELDPGHVPVLWGLGSVLGKVTCADTVLKELADKLHRTRERRARIEDEDSSEENETLDFDGDNADHSRSKLIPMDSGCYSNWGHVLEMKGHLGAAAASFRRALRHDPEDTSALWGLGLVLDKQRNWDIAEAIFREGMALAPEDPAWADQVRSVAQKRRRLWR